MKIQSLIFLSLLFPSLAVANTEQLIDLLAEPGSVGLGIITRLENSPYEGEGARNDLVPLYIYEDKYLFLHTSRGGIKLSDNSAQRFDLFFDHRFEGFSYDTLPDSLAGMAPRSSSIDWGMAYHYKTDFGTLHAEYLQDAAKIHKGNEARLGYSFDVNRGGWHVRPSITFAARNDNLNNYYYGVKPEEATATRPAYSPGAGTEVWLGIDSYYELSKRWRLLGSMSLKKISQNVLDSPIVRDGTQPSLYLGVAYDFGSHQLPATSAPPLYVKALYGKSTDCNLISIMRFGCASIDTLDNTKIAGIELGRPLIERLNGWPLDFVGYVGVINHIENGLQPDSLQVNAYIKGYFYGFPWSHRVKTRLGFGAGLSLAERSPYVEARDQVNRGRDTSRVLNYLDPSIDVSVGDLISARALKDTFFGFGVSHRSGIFGSSQLLGNVNGGSNYIYTYIESKI